MAVGSAPVFAIYAQRKPLRRICPPRWRGVQSALSKNRGYRGARYQGVATPPLRVTLAGARSLAPLFEVSPGLPDEAVKPFVAAVNGLTSAAHVIFESTWDILTLHMWWS